jgi:hypothetical protein
MASYVIVYAFDETPSSALAETFQLAERMYLARGDERPDLWASRSGFHQIEGALAAALATGQVRCASLLPTVPPPERQWLLTEWRGRLAVHNSIAHQLDPRFWTEPSSYELVELRVFTPSGGEPGHVRAGSSTGLRSPLPVWVETVAEYRASLETAQPTLITAGIQQVVTAMRDWFGALADERVGGAIAILAASGVTPWAQSPVVLRNPAALGMRRVTDRAALPMHCKTGRIAARVWGTTSGDPGGGAHTPRRTRRESRSLTAELTAMKKATTAHYGVLTELLATEVDTEVLIETGLVFEQEALNGVQNLAIAADSTVNVNADAARPVTTAQPAWCLNRHLTPPTGQAMRPTSLVVPLVAGMNQGTVWDLVERSLHSFGLPA